MGTNYYHHMPLTNPTCCAKCGGELCCETCDRPRLHIGKSSAGWTFSFQAHKEPRIVSFQHWVERLRQGGKIVDEYGRIVDLQEFTAMVASKQANPRNLKHDDRFPYSFLDNEGYAFSWSDFS